MELNTQCKQLLTNEQAMQAKQEDNRLMELGLDWLNISISPEHSWILANFPKEAWETDAEWYGRITESLEWRGRTREQLLRFVTDFLGYNLDDYEERTGAGNFGYNRVLDLFMPGDTGITILYGDSVHNGINIQLCGSALGIFRQSVDFDEGEFYTRLKRKAKEFEVKGIFPKGSFKAKVTRVDLSLDFINYGEELEVWYIFQNYIETDNYFTRIKPDSQTSEGLSEKKWRAKVKTIGSDGLIETIMLNLRDTEVGLRIYNKLVEQGAKGNIKLREEEYGITINQWTRSELQMGNEVAGSFLEEYSKIPKEDEQKRLALIMREQKNNVRIWDIRGIECPDKFEDHNEYFQAHKKKMNRRKGVHAYLTDAIEDLGGKLSEISQIINDTTDLKGVTPRLEVQDTTLDKRFDHWATHTGIGRLLFEISEIYGIPEKDMGDFLRDTVPDVLLGEFKKFKDNNKNKSASYIVRNKQRNLDTGISLLGIPALNSDEPTQEKEV